MRALKIQCKILKKNQTQTTFFLHMLKANLSENAFQKQMKAGAVDRNDILKHSKAYFFSFFLFARTEFTAFYFK